MCAFLTGLQSGRLSLSQAQAAVSKRQAMTPNFVVTWIGFTGCIKWRRNILCRVPCVQYSNDYPSYHIKGSARLHSPLPASLSSRLFEWGYDAKNKMAALRLFMRFVFPLSQDLDNEHAEVTPHYFCKLNNIKEVMTLLCKLYTPNSWKYGM